MIAMPCPCKLGLSLFLTVIFLFMRLSAGVLGSGDVVLQSITIFRTHEWLGKPSVYFRCQGEKKVLLPDVVTKDYQYTFIGEESWQPLTSFENSKCKRCGLYEEDQIKHDDVFDEWELCPINFSTEPEGGLYNHLKENEFNVTFVCSQCHPSDSDAEPAEDEPASSPERSDNEKKYSPLIIVLVCLGVVIFGGLLYIGHMRWLKKKREEQQARFMKLFEDDDDLEAELGLRDI